MYVSSLVALKNAAISVYLNEILLSQTKHLYNVSQTSCKAVVQKIPPGLKTGTFALNRCVNKLIGIEETGEHHQQYGEDEMKVALRMYCQRTNTTGRIYEMYGVPPKTLFSRRQHLMKLLNVEGDLEAFHHLVANDWNRVNQIISSFDMKGNTKLPMLDNTEKLLL